MDISSDLKRNELFLKSKRVTCKTKCKNVQVEFSIKELKKIKYNNEDAFQCDLPQNILYLQRRDYYRMVIPKGDKIICQVSGSNGKDSITLSLADISSGGIGVNETNLSKSFNLLELYHHCDIDLGEMGTITFDLELRNKRILKLNNNEVLRLGYKFVNLQTPDNAKIQRYIHNVDMRKKQTK